MITGLKMKSKTLTEENFYDKLFKMKLWIYYLMHKLLSNSICSPFFYQVLLVIEYLQLIYFSIHPKLNFFDDNQYFTFIRGIIQYFQLNSIISSASSNIYLILLYLAISIETLIIVFAVIILFLIVKYKKKTVGIVNFLFKIISFYAILITTILNLPFFNIFIMTFKCDNELSIYEEITCFQGAHFIHIIFSVYGLILWIFYSLLLLFFFHDINPISKIPFASPISQIFFLKIVIKMLLPLYFFIDMKGEYGKFFIIVITIVYITLLMLRYTSAPMYNKKVHTTTVVCEATLLWITLCSLIEAIFVIDGEKGITIVYMLVGIPLKSIAFLKILDIKTWNIMKSNIKNMKKESEIEFYLITLLDLIDNIDVEENLIKIEGIFKQHIKNCIKPPDSCVCSTLLEKSIKPNESQRDLWYSFLKSLIQDSIEKFKKSTKIHILYSFLQYGKLNNKFKALIELMISEDTKANLYEEFALYRQKNMIEENMIEDDHRNKEKTHNDVDVVKVIDFQNKFVLFLTGIENAVNFHTDFWVELMEESPDISKLHILGTSITSSLEIVAILYRKLNDINPTHLRLLEIYSSFLRDIVNDEIESPKILEKLAFITKNSQAKQQFINGEEQKYSENSNTCIVTASGNLKSCGIITNCNGEISNILGYNKNDIISQNVSKLMPKAYADVHDKFISNYFETAQDKVVGYDRAIYAQNKQGYIVPCTLLIKVLPNLDEGIQFVAFLKDQKIVSKNLRAQAQSLKKVQTYAEEAYIDANHFILFNGDTGTIFGISQSCYKSFGIPSSLIYGNSQYTNEFTIDSIIPELLNKENFDILRNEDGAILTLDTSIIQQNFLIGKGESDRENSEGNSKDEDGSEYIDWQNRFRRTKIHAYITNEDTYYNVKVQIIRFFELEEKENEYKNKNAITIKNFSISIKSDHSQEQKSEKDEKSIKNNEVEEKSPTKTIKSKGKNEEKKEETAGNDKEKTDQNQNDAEEEVENNKSQNSSMHSSITNEDMKSLLDFKLLVSSKSTPRSIKILNFTVLFLITVLTVLGSVSLTLKMTKINELNEGLSSIQSSYSRGSNMADVNLQIRKLDMLSKNLLIIPNNDTYSEEIKIKTFLGSIINYLKEIQFQIILSKNQLTGTTAEMGNELYTMKQLNILGKIDEVTYNYDNAFFKYITFASSVSNSSISSFNSDSSIESTKKDFYFIITNGLSTLREGSKRQALIFFTFYNDLTQTITLTFLIFMLLAFFFIFSSLYLLLKYIFIIHRTNNKVISLFGMIKSTDIKNLASKCEDFSSKYLENKIQKKLIEKNSNYKGTTIKDDKENDLILVKDKDKEKEEIKIKNPNEDQSYINLNNQSEINETKIDVSFVLEENKTPINNKNPILKPEKSENNITNIKPLLKDSKINNSNISQKSHLLPPEKSSLSHKQKDTPEKDKKVLSTNNLVTETKIPLKEEEKKKLQTEFKEEKEEVEINKDEIRQRKLMATIDNNKKIIFIQYLFILAIFVSYFGADYGLFVGFLVNVRLTYSHMELIAERPSILKYRIVFSNEEIATSNIQNQPKVLFQNDSEIIDVRKFYRDLMYDNEIKIFNNLKSSFPKEFDKYLNSFQNLNYDNVCEMYYKTNSLLKLTECLNISNGVLTKGLRTSIVNLEETTEDIFSKYKSTNNTIENKINMINDINMASSYSLLTLIVPVMEYLNGLFILNFNDFTSSQKNIENIKFSVLIVLLGIILFVIWLPYLGNVKKKIWRVKGMLNMIPMEIIGNNENLKVALISEDISAAVK